VLAQQIQIFYFNKHAHAPSSLGTGRQQSSWQNRKPPGLSFRIPIATGNVGNLGNLMRRETDRQTAARPNSEPLDSVARFTRVSAAFAQTLSTK
jgi:hypothetical protein